MTSPTVIITIERNEIEHEVEVEIEYSPAERGSRGSYGEPMEPDYEEYCEASPYVTVNGEEIELTEDEQEKAEQKFWKECDQYND